LWFGYEKGATECRSVAPFVGVYKMSILQRIAIGSLQRSCTSLLLRNTF
jgi:hypothetical protein